MAGVAGAHLVREARRLGGAWNLPGTPGQRGVNSGEGLLHWDDPQTKGGALLRASEQPQDSPARVAQRIERQPTA